MAEKSAFIVRESFGTYGLEGPSDFQPLEEFKKIDGESRFTITSPDGLSFGVGDGSLVNVYNTIDGSLKSVCRHRMLSAKFSPKGGYLCAWDNPNKNYENFNIWDISGKVGNVVHSLKLSKMPDSEFSWDEKIFARFSNNSVLFFDVPNFHHTTHKTPDTMKVASFSLSRGAGPLFALLFLPATTGPSFTRMYRYPNFEVIIASKSFFQADRADMKWSPKGNSVLVITSTDVDKTGESYYGRTMLYYMDTKGETASIQTETDTNSIHAAEWNPNSSSFCIISGKMPQTRAVLFNTKCEKIFEMGILARNTISFNPQGNILLLCGFGNLQGKVEVWEIKNHQKLLTTLQAPDTTLLHWLNDGAHFITATTAPRMQVGNGFKVWDFTGKCIKEWKPQKHLLGITPFISTQPSSFPEEKLEAFVKRSGNKSATAKLEESKPAAYIPVHKRKAGVGAPVTKSQAAATSKPSNDSPLSEKEKKIRTVKKKIADIQKLKEMMKEGKPLEKNQTDKLSKEPILVAELKALELS